MIQLGLYQTILYTRKGILSLLIVPFVNFPDSDLRTSKRICLLGFMAILHLYAEPPLSVGKIRKNK